MEYGTDGIEQLPGDTHLKFRIELRVVRGLDRQQIAEVSIVSQDRFHGARRTELIEYIVRQGYFRWHWGLCPTLIHSDAPLSRLYAHTWEQSIEIN